MTLRWCDVVNVPSEPWLRPSLSPPSRCHLRLLSRTWWRHDETLACLARLARVEDILAALLACIALLTHTAIMMVR